MSENEGQGTGNRHEKTGKDQPDTRLPFWRVMLSVFQAAFGVQNQSNRERDFKQASIVPFVVAALIFTLALVGGLVVVVGLVLGE